MADNIILIGFKAAGKSATGAVLARRLGWAFTDSDIMLESLYRERYGESLNCSEIYVKLGPEAMRSLESDALREVVGAGKSVIATGGGSVLQQANRELLKRAGCCIFLDTPLAVLEKRLAKNQDSPLFRHKSVAEVHAERYALYIGMADVHFIPADCEKTAESVERIFQVISANIKETASG